MALNSVLNINSAALPHVLDYFFVIFANQHPQLEFILSSKSLSILVSILIGIIYGFTLPFFM